jgi:hypothetical protein
VMIEDKLNKNASGKNESVRHEEGASSYSDMKADHPSFSAEMTVTDRGIMHTRNLTTGEFFPLGPLSGFAALLVVRELKENVMYY